MPRDTAQLQGRPLGAVQQSVLDFMRRSNRPEWYPGCGVRWGGPAETQRLMDSLVRRGLLTKRPVERQGQQQFVYTLVCDE